MTSKKPTSKKSRRPIMDIRVVKKSAKAQPTTVQLQPRQETQKRGALRRMYAHPLRKHPFVLPAVTFIVLSFFAMVAFVFVNGETLGASDTKVVNLSVDGVRQTVPTRATTVEDFLLRMNINLTEKDIVEPSLETEIIDNTLQITVYKARPVTIIDEGKAITTVTAAPDPRKAAEAAGVTVYPEDRVETTGEVVGTEDVLRGAIVSETISIDRATPANINLYGGNIPIRTHVTTVGDAIREKDIIILADDVITPAPETPLTPNTQIFITREGTLIDAREEEIAMQTEIINDPNLTAGRTIVRQQGNPGRKVVTYEVKLENDQEVSRRPIQEIIAVAPVRHIVVRGTKPPTIIVAGDHAALMLQAGIPALQHGSAEYIISRESRWRLDARNAGGCLGLGQACPGSKLINACPEYANDPVCQLRFFTNYVNGRYGGWNGAYNFWVVNHWY